MCTWPLGNTSSLSLKQTYTDLGAINWTELDSEQEQVLKTPPDGKKICSVKTCARKIFFLHIAESLGHCTNETEQAGLRKGAAVVLCYCYLGLFLGLYSTTYDMEFRIQKSPKQNTSKGMWNPDWPL